VPEARQRNLCPKILIADNKSIAGNSAVLIAEECEIIREESWRNCGGCKYGGWQLWKSAA